MQRREVLALVATAGAASVAGCGALGGSGGGSGGGSSSGSGGGSAIDGQSLAATHQEVLAAAGTYSLTFAIRMERTGADPLTQTVELVVDEANGRYLDTRFDSLGVSRSQRYVEADTVYSYHDGGVTNTESYDVTVLDDATRRDITFPLTVTNSIETVPGRTQFREVGTESFDGVTVTRYEGDGDPVVERTVDEVRYVMLVDGDGLVRYFERHTEVDRGNGERELVTRSWEFGDIGTATVDAPDWVGELR